MNEEENLKEETVEVIQSDNVDFHEKPCEEECCVECKGETVNKIDFLKSLGAICIDQIIVFILSAACVVLLNLILYMFGFFILSSYYIVFLFACYVVISIIYPAVMEATIGNTLGRKICNLKIFKTE